MSDERRALGHLLLGIEELLRAGAETAAALRAHTRPGESGASEQGSGDATRPLLDEVRAALAREVARWELRGDDDPAARRVRDLFEAILEAIEPQAEPEANARPQPEDRARKTGTRAPRRGVQR